jgi:hypothetical protein
MSYIGTTKRDPSLWSMSLSNGTQGDILRDSHSAPLFFILSIAKGLSVCFQADEK